jgi:ribosomal protein S18 acetylase RimI-like enzyme
MLLINKYCHAYVFIPLIIAINHHKLLSKIIKENGLDNLNLNDNNVNIGFLKVTLKMLISIGWYRYDGVQNKFTKSSDCPNLSAIPSDIASLYIIDYKRIMGFKNNSVEDTVNLFNIGYWLKRIERSSVSDSLLKEFMYAPIILPLLYLLKKQGRFNSESMDLGGLSSENRSALLQIFKILNFGDGNDTMLFLSIHGKMMIEDIDKAGVTLSYRQLLSAYKKSLYIQEHTIESGVIDEHLDRALNVIGSGSQHNIFFNDMVNLLLNKISINAGERMVIVDMGCGNGELLKTLFNKAKDMNIDGEIELIGVDLSKEALNEAHKNLKDLPHQLLVGNVMEPEDLIENLQILGVDKESTLHVRTFLDHNCPLLIEDLQEDNKVEFALNLSNGIFINENNIEILPQQVFYHYVNHFKGWKKITDKHGLVTLEVFTLSPKTLRKYLFETENLHFDAIHSLSRQYLLSASDYIFSAAHAGLFVDVSSFVKYPKLLPYTRVSLQKFAPRDYIIRRGNITDLDLLYQLEQRVLQPELRAGYINLKKRLINYSDGIYILEKENILVGVIYTQRISFINAVDQMTYETLENFYDPDGNIIQLLSILIAPEFQGFSYAKELLEFALLHSFVKENVKSVIGVSRCSSYTSDRGEYSEYIKRKNSLGYAIDPILNIHFESGATIEKVVPEFRKNDAANNGNGVLIQYKYRNWIEKRQFVNA